MIRGLLRNMFQRPIDKMNTCSFIMDSFLERVARFSDRRERTILGFDIDECIKRKIPPRKVELAITEFPYKITLWGGDPSLCLESERFRVQRWDDFDAYCMNASLNYTYYYNYETGRASIYRDGASDVWILS
jgi:hypothetical protein